MIAAFALYVLPILANSVLIAGTATAGTLPRFASLRASEVNLRTGPGVRYPVEWVFVRRGLPVEITADFDTWRKIRDWQGTEGWVHRSMLSGRRAAVITGRTRALRRRPAADAPVVARVEADVICRLLVCEGPFCRVEVAGIRGWIARAAIWGAYPGETIE
ncbi:MAG: SH3 domain-containing protein [Alphaproteobacteria bacterium]